VIERTPNHGDVCSNVRRIPEIRRP
jgi:hypothetical protein